GYADLAVGSPEEVYQGQAEGVVSLYKGSMNGLVPWRLITPDDAMVGAGQFGFALAAADLDGDGFPELIVGAPKSQVLSWATLTGPYTAGALYVFRGSDNGPTSASGTYYDQETLGLGTPANGDEFGHSVVAGRFNGTPGLAVGAPGRNGAGTVAILV